MRMSQKIYCHPSFIDSISKKRKDNRACMIAYKILLLLGDVYIDISREEFSSYIHQKDDNIYKALWKKAATRIHIANDWVNSFDPSDVADEIYFVDPGEIINYKEIRSDFGCLLIANDSDLFLLERLCRENGYTLIPLKERKLIYDFETKYFNNWGDILKAVKEKPLNAAIISDNYLFRDNYEQRKEFSLFNLLRNLVPINLKNSFHLTIFTCNDAGIFTKEQAEKIVEEIRGLNLCKDIKVTIVAHTKKSLTHDRKILTNYHYMTSGCGFNTIGADGPIELSEGEVACVFKSIDNLGGLLSVKQKYDYSQAWYKDILEHHIQGNKACFIVGDNINRLFKE